MAVATLVIDPAFTVSPVHRRTFGSFVEHLGRCVYTGIHEPDHPTAVEGGWRGDVLELVRELGVTLIRYPGGNFVSGYRWEDGVGPVEQRPSRLDLAWHSMEPNRVGVDEFMAWCKLASVEPQMAINLGTRGVQEALDILEYTNVPAGSHFADLRRANGTEDPHRIRLWCLGNEMDGPWQIGHKTAEEYGRIAAEAGRAMRMIDPNLELVACGSSSRAMPTFGEWERIVLEQCWDQVDMVSAHAYYYEDESGDLASFLASAEDMDRFIDSVAATADAVAAARKSDKVIGISFDEWNVWYQGRAESVPPTGDEWPVAPVLLEDHYTVADAVVVGDLLISLLRHSDRVFSANLAQLVNVIAPIMTAPGGAVWRQTTFHPFALTARHAKGEVLRVALDSPKVATAKFGEVDMVDAVATHDSESGETVLFLVNRSVDQSVSLQSPVRAGASSIIEALTYSSDDPYWTATAEDQSVQPEANASAQWNVGVLSIELPAVSWTMVRLAG